MTSPRRRLLAIAALTLAGSTLTACTSSDSDKPDSGDTTTSGMMSGGSNSGADRAVVLLDGWSRLNLAGAPLRVQLPDSSSVALNFTPATDSDIDAALARNPQAVEEQLARLVTADPALTCSADGCQDSSGPIDPHLLTRLDTVPGWGPMYRAWNTGGVWIASLPREAVAGGWSIVLDGTTSSVTISGTAPQLSPTTTSTGPAGPPSSTTTAPGEEDEIVNVTISPVVTSPIGQSGPPTIPDWATGETLPPDVAAPTTAPTTTIDATVETSETVEPATTVPAPAPAGNGSDVISIGAGFGQIFPLSSPWRDSQPSFGQRRPFLTDIGWNVNVAADGPGQLVAGLRENVDAAKGLNVSQLNALTAPTTGCGVGAVCTPDGQGVTITTNSSETASVCAANPDGSDIHLTVLLRQQTWELDGAKPFHQFGAGGDPEAGQLLHWPQAAPLVDSPLTMTVQSAELYDGLGALVSVSGRTDSDKPWNADEFAATSGGTYRPCPPLNYDQPTS